MTVQEQVEKFKEENQYGRFCCLVHRIEMTVESCLKRQEGKTYTNYHLDGFKEKPKIAPRFVRCKGCRLWNGKIKTQIKEPTIRIEEREAFNKTTQTKYNPRSDWFVKRGFLRSARGITY